MPLPDLSARISLSCEVQYSNAEQSIIFLFVSILFAVKYEPQSLQQNWQLNELPVYFLLRAGGGLPGAHSSCRWRSERYIEQLEDISPDMGYPHQVFPYLDKPYPARSHTADLCPGDGVSHR